MTEQHDQNRYVTQKELAEILNLSQARVSQLVGQGGKLADVPRERRKVHLATALRLLQKYHDPEHGRSKPLPVSDVSHSGDDLFQPASLSEEGPKEPVSVSPDLLPQGAGNLSDLKLKRQHLENERLEINLARQKGELLDRDAFLEAQTGHLGALFTFLHSDGGREAITALVASGHIPASMEREAAAIAQTAITEIISRWRVRLDADAVSGGEAGETDGVPAS